MKLILTLLAFIFLLGCANSHSISKRDMTQARANAALDPPPSASSREYLHQNKYTEFAQSQAYAKQHKIKPPQAAKMASRMISGFNK